MRTSITSSGNPAYRMLVIVVNVINVVNVIIIVVERCRKYIYFIFIGISNWRCVIFI